MTEPSIPQLLRQYTDGDSFAFHTLVQRYQGPLLTFARGMLGNRGMHEDVVQEAFLRLARTPPDLAEVGLHPEQGAAHLSAWLHRVTRNLCVDMMRSEAKRRDREQKVSQPEASGGGLSTVEARDTRAAVERSLDQLPPEQREVLVLRLLGDKSYREIADITGKKLGTIGWLISRGISTLSRELGSLVEADVASQPSAQKGAIDGLNLA
ncbi:MAG: RNA polymerase sigma factor [Planctomycetes bacterium]|nr:RNA polymerase sigma factor [Planctomycetota bacterium]MCB9909903.1 RNA polymerase sigma factor [Planctomycetota bacterium]MCB9912960.1 RNA polymerase sigma factor [Planctomycetota bacterium]HPF14438.1 RNA polymerase sigma factor [Planctomycetota bacterium]HRV80749.1 RNA polymerase sigma factor [Planctomycetota bacterium]